MWPASGREAMTALGRMFPSMTRPDGTTVPGIDPWDPLALIEWLNAGGEPTSGSRHVALFLLSIWNAEDWCSFGLKVRRARNEVRRIGRFDVSDALAAWDDDHRLAALAWLTNPFWP